MFEKEIEYNFTKNSLLFVKNNMYYKYDDLSNDYHRLQHEYNIYDGDNLIHKYLFNKDTYYDENLDPILNTGEDFCICFKKNYKKIKSNLQLHRHNRHGVGNTDLEIDDDNENYINVDYVDRNNNGKINLNTESISTNLEKINTNKSDISKLNFNKIYLKNLDNLIFRGYNYTISYNKDIPFYNKTFNFSFKKNDFIELYIKVLLKYTNIDDKIYVKSIYQIKNNDTILYTNIIDHNKY